jgi:hypothetical protein
MLHPMQKGKSSTMESQQSRQESRAYYQAHKEQIALQCAKHYRENTDAIQAKQREWRVKNPDRVRADNQRKRRINGDLMRANRRQHYRDNRAVYVANSRKREKHIKRATPPWSDLKAIEALYIQADHVSQVTGVKHHVDHFYPLRGKTMCGLHVPANMRIAPDVVNLAKGNAIPDPLALPLCCAWPMAYPHHLAAEPESLNGEPPQRKLPSLFPV